MNFCRRCGAEAENKEGNVYKCKNGHTLFLNSTTTAGIFFITENDEMILGIRANEPHKGKLDTVGGFVDDHETIEDALEREIREESGLELSDYSTPIYITSKLLDYPYDGEVVSCVTMMYYARLNPSAKLTPLDDVAGFVTRKIPDVHVDEIGGEDVKAVLLKLQEMYKKGEL